jgi:hypothetical protein
MIDQDLAAQQPQPHPPLWKSKRARIATAVAAVALAGGITAGVSLGSSLAPFTAHGTIELCDSTVLNGGGTGNIATDFPDITDGGQVTVVNQAEQVIGTGTLATGQAVNLGLVSGQDYTWSAQVPAGQARYGVQIGQNRGAVWFSETQMRSGPGTELNCGS